MLIQFSFNNFSSFKDDVIFSMVSGINNDKNNTFAFEDYKILPSSVIYGANASGKSNVLKAFEMMQHIVLNKDKTMLSTDLLSHNPFRLSTETENASTAFDVVFEYNGKKYKYGFDYDKQKVYSEYLKVYESNRPTTIFEYDFNEDDGKEYKNPKFSELKGISHNDNFLLLWAADQKKNEYAQNVLKWFSLCKYIDFNKFLTSSILESIFLNPDTEKLYSKILKFADFGIEQIYKREEYPIYGSLSKYKYDNVEIKTPQAIKTTHKKYNKNNEYVSDEIFDMINNESAGTNKFFITIALVVEIFSKGGILFIDELDANLHPLLTKTLVEMFNDINLNHNNAQLVFTCQDTNLLDSELFHKSQIWFTEKDKYGTSHLTSLAEFKDVRADDNFERNYIRGKYGAIPYLGDFDKAFLEQK